MEDVRLIRSKSDYDKYPKIQNHLQVNSDIVNSTLFNLNTNDNTLSTYSMFLGKQFLYNIAAVFKLLR